MDGSHVNLSEVSVTFQRQPLKWRGIAENLGQEFSCPISEVERMLSAAAHQLEQEARIKDLIPVLAVKQVRDLLRTSRQPPT